MRIAMVSEFVGDARGFGQERVVRDATALLVDAGHEVYYLAAEAHGATRAADVALIPQLFRNDLLSSRATADTARADARQWLSRVRPDVVHLHDAPDAGFLPELLSAFPTALSAHTVAATCPASGRFVPSGEPAFVCEARSGWRCLSRHRRQQCLSSFRSPLHRAHAVLEYRRKRGALAALPLLVAVSRYAERTLVADGWSAERVRVVYNPVPLPMETPRARSAEPLVVCAARLVPMKGVATLVRAAAALGARGVKARFDIAGDGPERAALEALARELGAGGSIRFLGALTFAETQRLVASATVYVQPNLGPEGFGLSAAEAAASGVAVIASAVGALDEIVRDGETGRTVRAGDEHALAAALSELLSQPERTTKLGLAGRERVRRLFSPEAHRAGLVSAYEELSTTRRQR